MKHLALFSHTDLKLMRTVNACTLRCESKCDKYTTGLSGGYSETGNLWFRAGGEGTLSRDQDQPSLSAEVHRRLFRRSSRSEERELSAEGVPYAGLCDAGQDERVRERRSRRRRRQRRDRHDAHPAPRIVRPEGSVGQEGGLLREAPRLRAERGAAGLPGREERKPSALLRLPAAFRPGDVQTAPQSCGGEDW